MISDDDIEKAIDYLRDNARRAAKARAEREYFDEYRKVIKAQIMREHDNRPIGAQESIAYADPRYIAHLEIMKTAIEADEYHRWARTAAEAKLQAWQTQSANNRILDKVQ